MPSRPSVPLSDIQTSVLPDMYMGVRRARHSTVHVRHGRLKCSFTRPIFVPTLAAKYKCEVSDCSFDTA